MMHNTLLHDNTSIPTYNWYLMQKIMKVSHG